MSYAVKSVFLTLQGEGVHSGQVCVFLRFAGCNLWSGREEDRASAMCRFCDTDFVGTDGLNGGKFSDPYQLAESIDRLWPETDTTLDQKWVVCTGGEPFLQLDEALIKALHERNFKIAVETNGTLIAPALIDWLCVSPKGACKLVQNHGDELKLVYPQAENDPGDFAHLDFRYFSIQPLDNGRDKAYWQLAMEYCLTHPQWRLSLQSHKILNID